MHLPPSVDLNKTALTPIVARLFVLLGLTGDAALGRIPRQLHRTILRVLQPAESAVRRLIAIVAKTIDVTTIKVKASRPRPPRARPAGLVRTGLGLAEPPREEPAREAPAREAPAREESAREESAREESVHKKPRKLRLFFKLFDPRQRFFRKPPRPKNEPRPRPHITFFRDGEYHRLSLGPEPTPNKADGLETSAHLVRRLQALKAALEDLPGEAMRLARAQIRRETVPHLKFQSPLRPGAAPGARKRPIEEIHRVLERCHWLAREALAPAVSGSPDVYWSSDTS